jgi:hypothetical protein
MSHISITESDISENDFGEDYKDAIEKSITLAKELDDVKILLKDKEFELNTIIQSLTLENENLKKSIQSYSELVEYYKGSENRTHNLINENNNTESYYIIRQQESKLLITEQNEYNLKREIINLKSTISELKSEIEKNNNNNNNSKIIEFDENEVKELINEIEDLKRQNNQISERALNMLTEKELIVLQLKEEIEELKEIIRANEEEIHNLKEELYSLPIRNQNYITEKKESLKLKMDNEASVLKKEFAQRMISWNEEKERLNNLIEELEQNLKNTQHEHEMEISKYRLDLMKYEYIENCNDDNEDKNKDNTIDNYPSIISCLEQRLAENETYYRSQIKVLQNEMDELDRENKSYTKKIEDLSLEIEDLKNENLKRLNSVQEKYINDNDIKLTEIKYLRSKIDTIERERDVLKLAAENNRKFIEKSKEEYNELNETLRKLRESHIEEKKKIEDKIIVLERQNIEDPKNISLNKLCDDDETIILRNKIANLENENNILNGKLNSFGKRSVNVFRLKGEIDSLKSENSKINIKMNEMKEQYELQINDLLQKLQVNNTDIRPSTKKPENFNSKQLIEMIELEEVNNKYKAENKFLSDNIEILKSEIENIKTIKDSIIKKLKDECDELKDVAADAKIRLAQVEFEKEKEITKLKLISRKMKGRLNSIYTSCTTDTGNTDLISPRKKSFFNSLFK